MTRKWVDFDARKTWAVLLSVFVLVFAVGGYGFYRVSAQRLGAERHNELAVIAALKSGQIAEWRQARMDDARMNAASPLFGRAVAAWLKDPGNTGLRDDFRARFRLVEEIYGYTGALLFDPDGRMLLNVRNDPEAVDAVTVAAVAQAVAEKQAILSELFRGTDGHICLDAVAPVLDADNQPVAAVVLRYDAQKYLYPLLQSWPVPNRSAETLLVRRDGDSVLYLNDLRFQSGAALTMRLPLTRTDLPAVQAVLGEQNEFEGNDYRGVAVLAHLELVPGSHWFMVAKVDRSEVLAEVVYRAWVSALFVVLLIGLTMTAMAFLARQRQFRVYQALHAAEQDKREAGQAQTVSELRYRRLFESARDGILILDAETGTVVDVNPYMIEITGHLKEEFLQRKVWELGFLRNIVANQDNFAELQEKEYVRYEDMPLESADGSPVDVEFVSNVYLVDGKKVIQCNIREISERKRAERIIHRLNAELEQRVSARTAQLKAANEDMEAFCHTVSHDLRAPLRHIDGYVELLVSRCRDGLTDKGLHYLDTIAASARQMGVLIDELLEFSRTGRVEMRRESVDMNRALQEAMAPLKEIPAGHVIEWVIGDLPSVSGDYALLRQVWANLLGNAVKYTRPRESARIEVSARQEGGETVFAVRDNGVGFDMRHAGKLFGIFQRLHSLAEFEGTGIGLATVQRIVKCHDGRVWAEAKPDRGAAFYFTVPNRKETIHA